MYVYVFLGGGTMIHTFICFYVDCGDSVDAF